MGISRESFGQIRDILRKLDHSIDTAREKRLQENERAHTDLSEHAPAAVPNKNGGANGGGFRP